MGIANKIEEVRGILEDDASVFEGDKQEIIDFIEIQDDAIIQPAFKEELLERIEDL